MIKKEIENEVVKGRPTNDKTLELFIKDEDAPIWVRFPFFSKEDEENAFSNDDKIIIRYTSFKHIKGAFANLITN